MRLDRADRAVRVEQDQGPHEGPVRDRVVPQARGGDVVGVSVIGGKDIPVRSDDGENSRNGRVHESGGGAGGAHFGVSWRGVVWGGLERPGAGGVWGVWTLSYSDRSTA